MKHGFAQLAKTFLWLLLCGTTVPVVGQVSVLTQHNDNARTGQNPNETTLNTSNVNQANFGKLFWRTVDGYIYAQPLYVANLNVGGVTRNVVYVATEHSSVYAFDADDPNAKAPLWHVNFGPPVPSQDICIITGDTDPGDCPYLDLNPEIGITSTPVIDTANSVIYIVSRIKSITDGSYHFKLHALDLTTGVERFGGPVEIQGATSGTGVGSVSGQVPFDPIYNVQRPGLLLQNGMIYIAFGSVGDIGTYHGWVFAYNATTLQQTGIFDVSPDGCCGGIWGAGQGVVGDGNNNVYVITADGDFNANVVGGRNYGDSFLKLNGTSLTVTDYFTPFNQATLFSNNTDLGSGGPLLLPGTSLLIGMGKDRTLRLMDTNNMGHYNASTNNDLQEFTATTGTFFGAPVYWNSPNNGPQIYVWGPNDFLKAYKFNGSTFQTTPIQQSTVQNSSGFSNAAALSVSANGSTAGSGILWTSASFSGVATGISRPGMFRAFDATDLTKELWNSRQNLNRDDVGTYAKFVPPTVVNGKVYMGSFSGQLLVYGLNPPAASGIRFIQANSTSPGTVQSTITTSFTSAQTAGNFNVVIVGTNDTTSTVQSITDSTGNTYTLAIGPTTGTGVRQSIYYAKNIAGGSNTVTVVFNQGATSPDVRILEYTGVSTTNPLDVSTGGTGSGNIAESGFVTTSSPDELIIGANTATAGSIVAGAPFNTRLMTSPNINVASDRVVNVSGSYDAWVPLKANGNWVMQVVTFRAQGTSTTPSVTSVAPGSGPIAGGTAVTITGTNFVSGATVKFGGTAATNVVFVNSTRLTATTPAHAAGAVDVVVTNPDTQTATLTGGYSYVSASAPTIGSVSPNVGFASGGTAVTVTGTNFANGATLSFGGTAATSVVVVSSTQITAVTPAHAAGLVNVVVTNLDAQSGTLTNGYTYRAAPTVTSVSPNNGGLAGGTPVTIVGANFLSGATVSIGGTAATSVVVVSSTQITATTPAHAAGAVNVVVTNSDTQSGTLTNGYTYTTAVAISFAQVAAATPQTPTQTINLAFPGAQTVGDLNVVVVGWNDATSSVQSVSDSAGNVYNLAIGPVTGTGLRQSIYYAANIAGGANTVTVQFNQAAVYPDIRILEYRGVSSVDVSAQASGAGTTTSAGPITTTSANELIFAANTVSTGATAAGTGFTSRIITTPDLDIAQDMIATSAGSYTATCPIAPSGNWVMQVVAFKAGSSTAPTISSVTPTSGSSLGNTAITITGTNFASGATVSIGGTAATNVVVVSSTQITAKTPAHAVGAVNVVVTNLDAQSATLSNGFNYVSTAPTVTSVSPSSGPATGGTAITIAGTNFVTGATVSIGGTAATNVVVVSGTQITATAPAHAAGAVSVVVTNADTQSGTLSNGYTYLSTAPTVTSVTPNSGPATGGTAITIAGTNFVTGATVSIGGTAATNVVVVSGTQITATAPAHAVGAVSVVVTNTDAQSGTLSNGYTYLSTAPTVTSVTPNSGLVAGGTSVTIAGTNFVSGATVSIGGTAATNVVVVNATQITATTPAHAAGAVSVVATNPDAQAGTLTNGFTYVSASAPTVSSVSPNSGLATGGTAVTITGANFVSGATVSFGGTAATSVVVVSASQITAFTPAHTAGAVNVVVTNPDAQSGTLTNGFTYRAAPTVTSVTPNNGPIAGGTAVAITGTNFAAGATVSIGGTAATNVVVVSASQITATTPAHAAGAVNVVVTNTDAQNGTLANGFTYTAAVSVSFAQVAAATPQTPTQTINLAFPGAQTVGDLNVVVVGWNDATSAVQSVTDSAGNVYSLAVGPVTGTGLRQSIYYAANIAGGTNTVTVQFNQAAVYPDIRILEYRGVSSVDVTAQASGAGTTTSAGPITTTSTNELIFAANTVSTGATAAGSGFTSRIITTPDLDIAEDMIAATAGSYTATAPISPSGNWVMQVVAFKAGPSTAPTISSVTPTSGTTLGNTAITINGTNFAAGATVSVGGTAATNVVVVNANQITATTPAHAAGAVNVVVTNTDAQTGTLTNGFTYVSTAPTVTSVTPNSGPVTGGTAVTIAGTNFVSGATVRFGTAAATNVVVVNATQITATTPANAAGAVSVVVTNTDTQSGTLSSGYTYASTAPTVTSVSPSSGLVGGGNSVTVTGTNFVSGATVTFGGAAATNVVRVSATQITATVPAHAAGAVNVVATNPDTQTGTLTNGYTYTLAPAPTVGSITPNSGPVAGGTAVSISGTNFVSGATVTIGGTAATNVAFVSATQITATAPAHAAGAVNVVVTNPDAQTGTLANGYTYRAAPTVTSVTPNNGPIGGGAAITIAGTNFASGATVSVGGTAATNVVVVSATQITATTPAHAAGAVNVVVTNSDSQSGTLTNGYTYTVAVSIGFNQVAASTPQVPTQVITLAYPAAQTVGNMNVVVVGWNDATSTVQSVTDSAGNTYNLAVGPVTGTGLRQSIYYAANINGGANTVTVQFNQAAVYPDIRILEYRGVSSVDVTASASGTGTATSAGPITTTSANALIFAANTVSTGATGAGTGFTTRIITTPDLDIAEDMVVTAAGTYTATCPIAPSGNWVMQVVAFK